MKARYDTPMLDAAGEFSEVTDGRWGWGRDWLWRSFPRYYGGGGGAIIIVGGGGRRY
ncbi:lasso RiPP family leader peptide-containing protein [Pseudofrankia inefficax]|uniref:Uncharacterized protein n=1 Tax=Pseudofrankia inefficax (strain DSM 45817 / CECT 9037 / DDB 130130 / EuI1c) TaxID=298654 RepID=E3J640_PSEI1|nr:lasso RiPP family leader peptide-containing protein [Pseudofrankia inefficax]ADP78331.1 hypothetical protein FraEuI1c_0245 [Pseudofrankia inefficax]